MTRTREFNAATVDEAVEKASATLGLPAEDFSYEVVDTGSDGFLGIGARDARILVEVPATAAQDTEEPAEEYAEPASMDSPATVDLSEVLEESSEAENVAVPEEL